MIPVYFAAAVLTAIAAACFIRLILDACTKIVGDTDFKKTCHVGKPTIKQIVLETGIPVEKFTCYDCPLANNCRSAFDPYNTDGDCLEMK